MLRGFVTRNHSVSEFRIAVSMKITVDNSKVCCPAVHCERLKSVKEEMWGISADSTLLESVIRVEAPTLERCTSRMDKQGLWRRSASRSGKKLTDYVEYQVCWNFLWQGNEICNFQLRMLVETTYEFWVFWSSSLKRQCVIYVCEDFTHSSQWKFFFFI